MLMDPRGVGRRERKIIVEFHMRTMGTGVLWIFGLGTRRCRRFLVIDARVDNDVASVTGRSMHDDCVLHDDDYT